MFVNRRRVTLLLLLGFSFGIVAAQVTTARLEGDIQDATGSVIPNARLLAVSNKTQVRIEVVSDPQGRYVFPTLQPGTYTLTVEAHGFRKATLSNVEMNVGETVNQVIKLELGQVSDTAVRRYGFDLKR